MKSILLAVSLVLGLNTLTFAKSPEAPVAVKAANNASALKKLRLLANKGDSDAQYNLGVMYETGDGVPQDYTQAMAWYLKAAEQGEVSAQSNLGVMYQKARGVPQDYKQAVYWYRKAAEQGDATAQYNLGVMYDRGWGVLQDYTQAIGWYRKAVDQGDADAQLNLGVFYEYGKGVPKIYAVAYALYTLSATDDMDAEHYAIKYIKDIAKKMSAKEIKEAQSLTQEMLKPKNVLKAMDKYVKNLGAS